MSDDQTQPLSLLYPFNLFGNTLRDFWYNFTYYPTTDWSRTINTQFIFGGNPQDIDVERHVLNKVGSYGSQLGKILDVMNLMVDRLADQKLDEYEQRCVERFRELYGQVHEAVAEFERKPRRGDITQDDLDHLIDSLHHLQKNDPPRHARYLAQLRKAVASAGTAGETGTPKGSETGA